MTKRSLTRRIADWARDVWRTPVVPPADDYSALFHTLYGTPDLERIIPGQYEQAARVGYSGNAVVFGVTGKRLALFSEARFVLRDLKDLSLTRDADELAALKNPWPNGVTGDLLARMEQDATLAGNAFVRDAGDRLERLRPDWVTIVSEVDTDQLGREVRTVIGYMYEPLNDPRRRTEFYTVDEIAHYAPTPDPLANFRGMSWLTPVIREINADVAMSEYATAYFENAATPNLIVKYAQTLKDTSVSRIRDMLAAKHTGSSNAFKTMILDAGADPMVVGAALTDVTFSALQAAGENRIAVAAGVPAIVAGLKEGLAASTLANYREAMESFADLTMRPLWRSACASLAKLVQVPAGKELWYDTRDISALQQGEKELADTLSVQATTVSTLITAGYTPESVVKAVTSGDLTLLQHTGRYSVQLRPPGAEDNGTDGGGQPRTPASNDPPPPVPKNTPEGAT